MVCNRHVWEPQRRTALDRAGLLVHGTVEQPARCHQPGRHQARPAAGRRLSHPELTPRQLTGRHPFGSAGGPGAPCWGLMQ
ncbi:hypothetical protein ACFQ0T_33895 [Kitasatospora gansuensis]